MQPPAKRRRVEKATVEEIRFDAAARQEFLTGFHKRKLQRAKHAQEAAERKARLERIEERRKLREERKADLERHLEEVNASLRPLQSLESGGESQSGSESAEADSWNGITEPPEVEREAEYVDEDRYTTVTIEALDVSKEGLYKDAEFRRNDESLESSNGRIDRVIDGGSNINEKHKWTKERPTESTDRGKKKKKKMKFRYESKGERKVERFKQKKRNSKQASARRAAGI